VTLSLPCRVRSDRLSIVQGQIIAVCEVVWLYDASSASPPSPHQQSGACTFVVLSIPLLSCCPLPSNTAIYVRTGLQIRASMLWVAASSQQSNEHHVAVQIAVLSQLLQGLHGCVIGTLRACEFSLVPLEPVRSRGCFPAGHGMYSSPVACPLLISCT
jgi:hypothetical protein